VLYATVQRERDGHSRWYTMCGRPVFGDGDTPVAFRGVTIDVSDLPVPTPTAPTDELLVAVLSQIDLALAVVEAAHQHIVRWLTAPAAGVAWPPNAYLAQLVHPDNRGELDRLCTPAAELPVGRRDCSADDGRPFGGAAQHAELVAFGVEEHRPPQAVWIAPVIVQGCSEDDPALDLLFPRPLRLQTQVQPVLHSFGPWHLEDRQIALTVVGSR